MNESFLQFIWKHRLYETDKLGTTDGSPIKVLSHGMLNTDAGPDFFNAQIQIGNTVWAGNVEIHIKSSDWYRHKHDQNPAYDNVILHVVKEFDQPVTNTKSQHIPTLVLPYVESLEENYDDLIKSEGWIACANRFHQVDMITLQLWFHALMVERLQQKTDEIIKQLEQNKNDWNETFYQFLARNFGFKTNTLPFELLAKTVPLAILSKHKNDLFQLEALLFGTAGLLNKEEVGDDYFLSLQKEFSFLQGKYKLKTINEHLWKFLRLRPVNFPTIRIAQFANLIHHSSALFSRLIEIDDLSKIRKLFHAQASIYWDTHYRFNKTSAKSIKHFGDSSFFNIVINTIVPFLFVYGDFHNNQHLKNRALEYLEKVPSEKNSIINNWQKMGVRVGSAFDSQALIQLKNCYCNPKKCLNCPVGTKLISLTINEKHEPTSQQISRSIE